MIGLSFGFFLLSHSTMDSFRRSATPSGKSFRSKKSEEREIGYDNNLQSISSSLSKFVDSCSPQSQNDLKYKVQYKELDKVLCQTSYIDALKFHVEMIERANDLLLTHTANTDK